MAKKINAIKFLVGLGWGLYYVDRMECVHCETFWQKKESFELMIGFGEIKRLKACFVVTTMGTFFLALGLVQHLSVSLLELVVPPVEVDVKHYHRSRRQACHQKPETIQLDMVQFQNRTCDEAIFILLTFDRETKPGIEFHYHKPETRRGAPSWTSSRLQRFRDRLRSEGILHLLTWRHTEGQREF